MLKTANYTNITEQVKVKFYGVQRIEPTVKFL